MKFKIGPYLWSVVVMALALALSLFVATHEKVFAEEQQIVSPDVSLWPVLLYFFGVVAVVAIILFIIPLKKLRLFFRILFAFMFAWGIFIVSYFFMPRPLRLMPWQLSPASSGCSGQKSGCMIFSCW